MTFRSCCRPLTPDDTLVEITRFPINFFFSFQVRVREKRKQENINRVHFNISNFFFLLFDKLIYFFFLTFFSPFQFIFWLVMKVRYKYIKDSSISSSASQFDNKKFGRMQEPRQERIIIIIIIIIITIMIIIIVVIISTWVMKKMSVCMSVLCCIQTKKLLSMWLLFITCSMRFQRLY